MNCNRAELSFSSHYDGQLSAAERVALDSHLATCAPCRTAFAEYVRAISDLKKLRPGPTSRQHVADVMARIDLDAAREVEAPRTASWRRAMTHLVAAAVGAAAAVLVLQQMNARESHAPGATPGVVVTPPSNREIAHDLPRMPGEGEAAANLSRPVRFVGDPTSLERNDRLVSVSDGFTLKPGETVRTLPSQSVEITVDENGLLTIKTKTENVLTPPKAVNEVHFVELPPLVSVDRKLVTDAVDTFGSHVSEQIKALDLSGVRSFVDQIETQIEDSIAATDAREAANEAAATSESTPPEAKADLSSAVDSGGASASTHTAASAFAPMTFIASEAPVTIQRSGDRSALSVQGSLPRVIPELIALLKNDDGEIADLAAAKLDFVRTDLERSPTIGKKLSPLPAETERVPRERGSRFSELLHTRFGADDTVERKLTPTERWTRWWQANAVLIATGSSSDT